MSVTTETLKTRVTTNLKNVEDLTRGDRCKFFNEDGLRAVASVRVTSDSVTVTFERGNVLRFDRQEGVFNLVEVAV